MQQVNSPFISSVWRTDSLHMCTSVVEHAPGLLLSLDKASLVDYIYKIHPEDGPHAAAVVAIAIEGRRAFRHEHRALCSDKQTRWVMATGLPRVGDDGQFEGFTGAFVDITEQRQVLDRALRSEAEYRLIVDHSVDLVAHCGLDGTYIHVSPSYTLLVGWSAEEMIGHSVVGFLHADDRAGAQETLDRMFNGEDITDVVEVRKRHRNGNYISLGTKVCKVNDPVTGRVLGAVLMSRDITSEKEMLQRIERMAEQNTALIENSPDIMMLLDIEGTVLHANRAVQQVLGYTPEELIGTHGILRISPEGYSEAADKLMTLAHDEGHVSSNVLCLCKSGRPLQLEWSMYRPPASNLIYATARDVTEKHRTRLALEKAHAQVRNILESIDDGFFSVNANWELTYGNTLAAVFSSVDLGASIGKVLWDVTDGLTESSVAPYYRHAMEKRENAFFETFFEPAGVWLSVRVYAHEDGLSVFFHDISARKHAEAHLERLATRDVLTGLPNRAWLNQHLKTMLGQGSSDSTTTVLFIDLNHFKEVNDSMGHAAGDYLLQQVGQRLESCMRPGDVVARLGGDEFVVAAHCSGPDAAGAIAQRLLATLKAPVYIDGLEMCVGASIGISLSDANVDTPELLFQNADTAMYRAKAVGESSYRFFEPEMSKEAKRKLQL
jgi:diguanylate cyclase (GGDEF)-like protein/PAS domain S-box-containing protein